MSRRRVASSTITGESNIRSAIEDTRESAGSNLKIDSVDTRAAVALLSRSVRIVSAGDTRDVDFPPADSDYFYGGHTMVRQGFAAYQMQGVEFYQLGQGGRLGHYPVHFHMVRNTPNNTFVKDCSIHDSMTRWITLHATQGVLLARNVGYMSIGHGYYIEDGTETDNKLYSNIGILARAAVDNVQNPRKVPGILSATFTDHPHNTPYHSDSETPTVFWIMNGWNDFQYNFAAGAGSCGACYWLTPGYNSGSENTFLCYNPATGKRGAACLNQPPPPPPGKPECEASNGAGFICAPYSKMAWKGYASMQSNLGRAGMTPLMNFVGNTCTSAMNSFQTVGEFAACNGVAPLTSPNDKEHLAPIPNPLAPPRARQHRPGGVLSPRGRRRVASGDPVRRRSEEGVGSRLRERRHVPQVRRQRAAAAAACPRIDRSRTAWSRCSTATPRRSTGPTRTSRRSGCGSSGSSWRTARSPTSRTAASRS